MSLSSLSFLSNRSLQDNLIGRNFSSKFTNWLNLFSFQFQEILKPNYNSVDLTEVELVDQYDSVPRGNDTQLLAVSKIVKTKPRKFQCIYNHTYHDHVDLCFIFRCPVCNCIFIYMQRERAFSLNIIHILRITYSTPTIAVSGMHHHHPLPSPNLQADAKKNLLQKT